MSAREAVLPRELTVLLCDDQPVVCSGLNTLLRAERGITVVGTVGSGRDLVREVVLRRPDVLVLDPQMFGFLAVTTIRELRRAVPGVAVLVFTAQAEESSVQAAVGAGARGYVLKSAQSNDIVRAVRGVADGGVVFCPQVGRRLAERMVAPAPVAVPFPCLTVREREVLTLMAAGLSNTAIAGRLSLSTKTVSNHISSIFAKMRVATRAEAIVAAREAGLGVA
ncbi:DNA-binding NarL/FixJ family response regulator [Crossiella equi]|uniref:DNA-binding NarL/FixJ family response regulator n=1 Tax=Crossiella equi TaxID=130796 RepID=A0ABS5AMT1_9PSEU|nr:response regulator transcription factor [Crossiella equi]MBP2477885.1 DNA-binding NarL/FixJ family response regulator [Crossiella equi]